MNSVNTSHQVINYMMYMYMLLVLMNSVNTSHLVINPLYAIDAKMHHKFYAFTLP